MFHLDNHSSAADALGAAVKGDSNDRTIPLTCISHRLLAKGRPSWHN
jgi:hypothetical protein